MERNLAFPECNMQFVREDGKLYLTTDRFARCVELSAIRDGEEFGWIFEDNYFDLFPWEKKEIRLLREDMPERITATAQFGRGSASIQAL